MMKYVILALALTATVRADDWSALDLDDQSEARLLFSTNSSSGSIIPDARAILGFGLVAVLLLVLLGGSFTDLLPAEREYSQYGQQNYYDEYAQYPNEAFSARYGVSDLATKMQQLEAVFKKFAVETEECQQFVSCEAAQLRKLNRNVPIVQIVNRILSVRGEEEKLNPRILEAFNNGLIASNNYVANACQAYREQCYVAHNNNQ